MIYKYGSYSHDEGEVSLTVKQGVTESPRGGLERIKIEHSIRGRLRAADSSSTNAKVRELESAYLKTGVTCGLYFPDGSATAHIINANNPNLIRPANVRQLDYPTSANNEMGTYRTYNYVITAELWANSDPILQFTESLTSEGGQRSRSYIGSLDGRQLVERLGSRQPYTYTQSGSMIVRVGSSVGVPPPIFNRNLLTNGTSTSTPREIIFGRAKAWEYSWTYNFSSTDFLNGTPNVR
jgi:hypothetical protein